MSLNIDIDKYGNMSVVPIKCGGKMGTAFFVNSNQLLTANHILSSYIDNSEQYKIMVCIMDEWVECSVAYNFQPLDVVLLHCSKPNIGDNKLQLLLSDCLEGEKLKIVGFPQEIGNGVDYFGVDIRNSRHLKKDGKDDTSRGFNVVAIRTDELNFSSYGGFSGSPVLNVNGDVVGIATDQYFNTLGYTSIKIINDLCPFQGLGIDVAAEDCDMSPFGLGTSWHYSNKKIKEAGSRYSPNTHISNESVEETLKSFCCIGVEEKRKEIYNLCSNVYNEATRELYDYLSQKNADGTDKAFQQFLNDRIVNYRLCDELDFLLYAEKERSDERILINPLRKDIEKSYELCQDVLDCEIYEQSKCLYVTGIAGNGKTHSLCRLIEQCHAQCAFYLFYGTDFSDRGPLETILSTLHWHEDDLHKLNDYAKIKDRYAVFVVDALNEGSNTDYWRNNLSIFKEELDKYERIKLLVSFRTMACTDVLQKQLGKDGQWKKIEISGFENTKEAIKKHFEINEIQGNVDNLLVNRDFQNPLFLKIFCEAFTHTTLDDMREYSRVEIYNKYLQNRNYKISQLVDEDSTRQITSRFVIELAKISVNESHCMDIIRNRARKIADSICKYRTWSKNLMNILLKENILKEYRLSNGKDFIGFEFDSMGDVLKAGFIHYKGDTFVVDYVLRTRKFILEQNRSIFDYSFIPNVFTCLFAEWKPNEKSKWERLLAYKDLRQCFMQGLSLRHDDEEYSMMIGSLAKDIIAKDTSYISPYELLENFRTYKYGVLQIVLKQLDNMTIHERDEKWTIKINELQRHYGITIRLKGLLNTEKDDYDKLSELICWFLTSSFQTLRAVLIMYLRDIFKTDLKILTNTTKQFARVNDPYILQGLFAAVYATLVLTRNTKKSKEIAEYICCTYYNSKESAPTDLVVRNWTMRIVEYASYLDKSYNGWSELKNLMPFNSVSNPFKEEKYDEASCDGYFGTTNGAKMLYDSLFTSDFNRYIIGTNGHSYSDVFVNGERNIDETAELGYKYDVNLDDIAKAIAILIKEKYKYSDALGNYDKDIYSRNRFDQSQERIGKKYQWIGYYEVLSYLCDHYKILLDKWSAEKKFAAYSFPWLTGAIPYMDPTIEAEESLSVVSHDVFEKIDNDFKLIKDETEWLEDDSLLPSIHHVVKDKDGNDWVILKAFDTQTELVNNTQCCASVWYDTVFVANSNITEFEAWAQRDGNLRQYFYSSGDYNYLWNDYPWSSNYRERQHYMNYKDKWILSFDVIKTYSTQLQEEFIGCYAPMEHLREAHSPSETIMQELALHNAERGIVRDENGSIIAMNINSTGSRMSGLAIRKEKLDEFLKKNDITMFCFNSCVKDVRANLSILGEHSFSALYKYDTVQVSALIHFCKKQ